MHMTGAKISEISGLLDRHHYLGARCADPMHVFAWRESGGLFGDYGTPLAAIVYSAPANKYFGRGAVELCRLVRSPDLDQPLSEFVAWSLRWLRANTEISFCLSYADSGAGHHGGIYQALSFDFIGPSKGHSFWMNPKTGDRCSSRSFDQRRPEYKDGWIRKAGTEKFLYVRPLREKRRKLLKRFNWESRPYPKPGAILHVDQQARIE